MTIDDLQELQAAFIEAFERHSAAIDAWNEAQLELDEAAEELAAAEAAFSAAESESWGS